MCIKILVFMCLSGMVKQTAEITAPAYNLAVITFIIIDKN